jgi:hypothetical protein
MTSGLRWTIVRRAERGLTVPAGLLPLALVTTWGVALAPAQETSGPAPAQVVTLPRRAANLAVNEPSRFA